MHAVENGKPLFRRRRWRGGPCLILNQRVSAAKCWAACPCTCMPRPARNTGTYTCVQAMWYEISSGNSHLGRREWGRALKKFTAVVKHFADINEDQFDFHSYCIRKMTLRPYLAMLRMEDALYAHPAYGRAVAGAVRAYLHIADFGLGSAAGAARRRVRGCAAAAGHALAMRCPCACALRQWAPGSFLLCQARRGASLPHATSCMLAGGGSADLDEAALAAMDPEARRAYKLAKKKEVGPLPPLRLACLCSGCAPTPVLS